MMQANNPKSQSNREADSEDQTLNDTSSCATYPMNERHQINGKRPSDCLQRQSFNSHHVTCLTRGENEGERDTVRMRVRKCILRPCVYMRCETSCRMPVAEAHWPCCLRREWALRARNGSELVFWENRGFSL